jgi:hypothetical protein
MDYKRYKDILKELEGELSFDKILKYKAKLIQHLDRIQRDGIPRPLENYKPHKAR